MATIEDLQKLELTRIKNASLRKALEELLSDYREANDKAFFKSEQQNNIDQLFAMVGKYAPQATGDSKSVEGNSAEKEGPPEKKARKKQGPMPKKLKSAQPPEKLSREASRKLLEELELLEPELAACRKVIKEHNAKKRAAQPPRAKPTRHTQLKMKLLGVIGLIPEKMRDDEELLEKTEEILLSTHAKLITAWGMDKVKAKGGEEAIKEKIDDLQERQYREERKKKAQRWKKQLPALEEIMQKEWKGNESLEQEARQLLAHFKTAIKHYESDPDKALKFLKGKYSNAQLKKHLPGFMRDEWKIK